MNSKLLIFIFVLIGFKSIDSSIIKYESIDGENFVKIDGLNYLNIGNNQENDQNIRKHPFKDIKELTFNKSETIKVGNKEYPQLICNNSLKHKLCTIGNGKYQAQFVKCINIKYNTPEDDFYFLCEHSGHRVTNKNLEIPIYMISCAPNTTQENFKKECLYQYSYRPLPGFTEDDDVEQQ